MSPTGHKTPLMNSKNPIIKKDNLNLPYEFNKIKTRSIVNRFKVERDKDNNISKIQKAIVYKNSNVEKFF